jgi:ketosteroid isomerase-like protein
MNMSNTPELSSRAELKRDVGAVQRSREPALSLSKGTLRFLCVSAALALLLYPTAFTQQKTQPTESPNSCSSADAAAIGKIADDFRDAYNRGDAAQVASLYTDGAYYLTQHYADGIIEGRNNIQAYVQRGVDAHYHIDSIDVLKVNCACATSMPSLKARIEGTRATRQCNFAYAIARYQSTNDGQKAMGVNLVVLRKFQGTWRIVAHESAVPDPASAIKKLD